MLRQSARVPSSTRRSARAASRAVVGGLTAIALGACADHTTPTGLADGMPASPQASATLAQGVAPVCHTETFEEFSRGAYVTTITPGPLTLAVRATAFRNTASNVAGRAQIFDTDHVSASLTDGTDMEWAGSYARCDDCEGLGNLLIVHRYGSSAILDNNPGGRLSFTGFPAGRWWVESFTVVDNDRNELGVRLVVDGAIVASATPLGDGSVQTVVPASNVLIDDEVRFTLGTAAQDTRLGSGGIDDVKFCTNPPPPANSGNSINVQTVRVTPTLSSGRVTSFTGSFDIVAFDQPVTVVDYYFRLSRNGEAAFWTGECTTDPGLPLNVAKSTTVKVSIPTSCAVTDSPTFRSGDDVRLEVFAKLYTGRWFSNSGFFKLN